MYEVLTCSPPFLTGDISYQQVHNTPVNPLEINSVIPQSIAETILKCLAKDPDDRMENAEELKVEFARELAELGGCKKYKNHNSTEMADPLDEMDELDMD